METDLLDKVLLLCSEQHGLVSRRQCLALGCTEAAVDALLRQRRLLAVAPGVYSAPGAPAGALRQVWSAVLAAGPEAAVASQTAAALLGLDRVGSLTPVHLLVRDTTPDSRPGVVTHRTVRLDPCDVTTVQGVRCTTGARTLIDLAAVVDRIMLTALVDDAIGLGIVSRGHLHRRAIALRPGRRGVGVLVALTADDADARFRSWLERRAAHVLSAGDVPAPKWNEPIRDGGRLLGIADACWRTERLIAEFDGMRFHSGVDNRRADARRERDLVLGGWRVLRFTWLDVEQSPHVVVSALRHALTRTLSESR